MRADWDAWGWFPEQLIGQQCCVDLRPIVVDGIGCPLSWRRIAAQYCTGYLGRRPYEPVFDLPYVAQVDALRFGPGD